MMSSLLACSIVYAEELSIDVEDEATIEDGEVTHVEWPNRGSMSVNSAELDDGTTSGTNSRGEDVEIKIDN